MNLAKLNKNRTLIKDVFKSNSKNVEIAGWVHNTRDLSKVRFLVLRDISGIIQVTGVKGKTDEKIFKMMEKVSRESVVYIKGSVKDSKQAPGGKEINPDEMIVISEAEKLPIDVSDHSKTELPKRLDYRFLDLHRQRTQAIFKIQSTVGSAFKEYFVNKGFVDMHPPSLIGSSSEGGTDLFKAKYFEKDAYLAQSPQLYKQMVACAMEKVVTITPVWRAEKHNTVRHINECRQMDIEMAFANTMIVMKEMESAVKYIVEEVMKKNKDDLDLLEVKLKVPKSKYMTFEEAVKLLKKNKINVEKDDLTPEAEKKLDELFPDTVVFVYDWPMSGKPFYIMPKSEKADAKVSEGFDAIYRGAEISSGGQRVHLPDLLIKRLKANGLNPKSFKSYIDSFRFGAPPHAGWSIGIERFTQVLLRLPNIREGVLFPRDRDRLSP
ncbi:aspartate--tRNA(Asn) ligase [Candidatus Pacearchaeota archaeon]|nr:aspartate--tRNA(Asn) ligase [Candidatus Pacearchaeota archaeon]